MKVVYLTVRCEIPDDLCTEDFASECDVTITYDGNEVEQTVDEAKEY